MKLRTAFPILLLSVIWGSSFILIRIADGSFPPLWIALLRSTLGGGLLWAVLLVRRGRNNKAGTLPRRDDLPMLLLVALFNNVIPFICFAWGEQVVPSNTAAVLNATVPLWTLLLAVAVHRRRIRLQVAGGVVLGFMGVLLVVVRQHSAPLNANTKLTLSKGVALIATGALGYAIATTIAKAKLQAVPPLTLAATQLSLAACILLPITALGPRPTHLHPATLLAIAALGCFGSGIAYLLFFHLLTGTSATHAVAVTYLLPIWGILWGVVAHEHMPLLAYAGVAVAVSGLVLMNLPERLRSA